jgi:hypothetical protein
MAKSKAITSKLGSVSNEVRELAFMIEKLSNSATSALTQNQLTQAVNADLLEAQNRQKSKKKQGKERVGDARVMSTALLKEEDEVKQVAKEKVAREKRLATQAKRWVSFQSQTITQFMKWGPELLLKEEDKVKQAAKEKVAREKRLATQAKRWVSFQGQTITQFMKWGPELLYNPKPLKELPLLESGPRTPLAPRKRVPKIPKAHMKAMKEPILDFPNIPLPTLQAPPKSPSKAPPKQAPKRHTEKVKEVVVEPAIEVPVTISKRGRVVRKKAIWEWYTI